MLDQNKEWELFLRAHEARYQPRIYALIMANMAIVAAAIEKEDNPESVLVRLGSLLQVTGLANLLLSLYANVGMQRAIASRAASNAAAKFNDRINRLALKETITRQMQISAIKNAHDIIRTQKKQVARMVEAGKAADKSTAEIAKDVKANKYGQQHSILIARTETPAAGNKGALAVANQSEYVYTKRWWSMHDEAVRFPGNPAYAARGWPDPKFTHMAVHGQALPLDQPFNDTLGYIMYPGDTDSDIGNRARCRCWLEMVLMTDSAGRPIKKNGVTVIMPRGRLGQQSQQGDITVIHPEPDITVIMPNEIPKRPTITI